MYTVSNEFKENVQSNAVVATARITLVADGTVLDGNNLASVSIKDYCNNNGTIIGTTMCKEAEIEIINNGYDLADKEFLLEVGVEVAEDTIEYIPYGNFIVKEYTDMKSNNKYKIVAYDYMDKLNKEFTDNNTYPMTLQAFYEALATQYGVQIETQTLPNQEFIVQEKPYFDGATGRTVLSAIAQMFGSFAKFNRDNKLQMYLKNETGEQISREQMNSTLEIDNRYGPLNTVVLSLGNVKGENVTLKSEELINQPAGKNLISLPYYSGNRTMVGVEFKVNEDGSILANGTATADGGYTLIDPSNNPIPLKKGAYTLSGNTAIASSTYYLQIYVNGISKGVNGTQPLTFSAQDNDNATRIVLFFRAGTVFDNVVIKPMLEKGNIATEFEPFKPTGEVTLEIVDNPFVYTEELRSNAIQGIYDRVLGFTYVPTSFNYKAYLYLDCGDAVQVQQMKTDDYVDTIILNQEIKVPATRKSKCTNTALTKTQVENQYVSPEKQAKTKTELSVLKHEQEINALVSETDAQGQQITTITANLNGVTTRVENTEERIETAEGNIADTNEAVTDLGSRVTDEVANLQSQIDGAIQFWNGPTIPTLSNEPAVNWETEIDRNNHRADIYTVIEDVQGELKQGKSYRFDKVGTNWVWVELTDNELSAVQALAASKAKVFVTTPRVPYNVGDLWIRNKELYECITAKDANGTYSEADWQKATKYTDDTAALLAQYTADTAIANQTITATTEEGRQHYLPDSADNYCKSVEIFGESTQKTRSGKNKLPNIPDINREYGGLNITVINNEITIIGTSTFNGGRLNSLLDFRLPAGSYKLGLTRNVDVDVFLSNTSTAAAIIGSKGQYSEFTLIEETQITLGINVFEGVTYNDKFKVMIVPSDVIDYNYEPYGAMPSPEFPSEIESVSRKNLFNVTEFEANLVNQKIINDSGVEVTDSTSSYSTYKIPVKANQDYYIKGAFQRIYFYDTNKNFVNRSGINAGINSKYTPTEDGFISFQIQISYWNANKGQEQVEKGSVPSFYVPYNHIGFKSVGKNLFNYNGYTFDKTIFSTYRFVEIENLKPNTTYAFYNYDIDGYMADEISFGAVFLTRYPNYGTGVAGQGATLIRNNTIKYSYVTFTTGDDGKGYLGIYLSNGWTEEQWIKAISYFEKAMFTEGTEQSEYEPYKESITTIPLLHDMRSLPNGTRDRIYSKDGKWYDEQKVYSEILSSSNTITKVTSDIAPYGYYFTVSISKLAKYVNANSVIGTMLSSHFKVVVNSIQNFDNGCITISSTKNKVCLFVDETITTIEELAAWLSENNVQIQYEPAEPIITEITDEAMINALESIRTFKGVTNIEADAPSILTYYRDVPIVDEYETKINAEKNYKVTEQKFAEQKITNDAIINSVSEVKTTITEDYMTKEEASTQYTQLNNSFKFDINNAITNLKEEGIAKVVTTQVTIDDNGITVGKSNSEFTNTMNNTGSYQYNAGELVAKYDKDGAEIPRLKSDFAIIAGLKYTKEDISGIVHHKTYVLE